LRPESVIVGAGSLGYWTIAGDLTRNRGAAALRKPAQIAQPRDQPRNISSDRRL